MHSKILITVSGGTIQNIFSNDPEIKIVIADYDNQAEGNDAKILSDVISPDIICENMYEYFTDESDPQEMEIRDELKRIKF